MNIYIETVTFNQRKELKFFFKKYEKKIIKWNFI